MKRLLGRIVLLAGLALVPLAMLMAQTTEDAQHLLVLSDAVLPTPSKDALLDPRIFNPEFYRKFNPDLGLSTDQEAIQQWTSSGANHCLRASFNFYSTDYLNRYPDLKASPATPGACDYAIRQFVTYGFNQGRVGAFDGYPNRFRFQLLR
jgi:hypothetical protein